MAPNTVIALILGLGALSLLALVVARIYFTEKERHLDRFLKKLEDKHE